MVVIATASGAIPSWTRQAGRQAGVPRIVVSELVPADAVKNVDGILQLHQRRLSLTKLDLVTRQTQQAPTTAFYISLAVWIALEWTSFRVNVELQSGVRIFRTL